MVARIHAIGLFFLIMFSTSSAAFGQARVEYVPEMQALHLERFGQFAPDATRQPSVAEQQAWPRFYPFVLSLVDDQKIVELSRWAVAKTADYHFEPSPLPPLAIVGVSAQNIVYQVTLAELPSDHASVRRYLRAFIVGHNHQEQLLPNVVIITIQGTRDE